MAKVNKKATKLEKTIKGIKLPNFSSSVNLTTEQMKEKVVSLRSDSLQSINSSIAVSMLALLLFIGAPSVFPEIINPYLPSSLKIMQAIVIVPSIFWVLTLLVNAVRFVLVFKLQKKLSK